MPVNIQITDTQIIVQAENGDTVVLDRQTGSPAARRAPARTRATPQVPDSVKVSPRWTVHVGDPVMGQHKKGGRKFRTTVRGIKEEHGSTFVQVADPRNGGTYFLALDRIAKATKY